MKVTGAFCERFFNLCAFHQIAIWSVVPGGDGYEFFLNLKDLSRIRPLVRKCHVHIKILRKNGFPFFLIKFKKQKALLPAMLLSFLLIFLLSGFLWSIQIKGNQKITSDQIDAFLREEHIFCGMKKSSIDCKSLASEIRMKYPIVSWVSVRLDGTKLLIDLRESDGSFTDPGLPVIDGSGSFASLDGLYSDVDGMITDMITRTGTPLVQPGDEIRKGDLLIAGYTQLLDDAGEPYERIPAKADGDIYVLTEYNYKDRIPVAQQVKSYTGKEKKRILLQLGLRKFGIPFFHIGYENYDILEEKRQLRLGEYFLLPAFLAETQIREYEVLNIKMAPSELKKRAEYNLEQFLENFQKKGVQIFENDVKIDTTDSFCTATGKIVFIVKVGSQGSRILQEE